MQIPLGAFPPFSPDRLNSAFPSHFLKQIHNEILLLPIDQSIGNLADEQPIDVFSFCLAKLFQVGYNHFFVMPTEPAALLKGDTLGESLPPFGGSADMEGTGCRVCPLRFPDDLSKLIKFIL